MDGTWEHGQDLKHALAAAEAASVPGDLLEQGRFRLSQLLEQLKADQKRKAAEEALQAAMAAETVGPLEMAIARAEAADVNREARVELAMLMRYRLFGSSFVDKRCWCRLSNIMRHEPGNT